MVVSSMDHVVAIKAGDGVITTAAFDEVGAGRADDTVAVIGIDDVVALAVRRIAGIEVGDRQLVGMHALQGGHGDEGIAAAIKIDLQQGVSPAVGTQEVIGKGIVAAGIAAQRVQKVGDVEDIAPPR